MLKMIRREALQEMARLEEAAGGWWARLTGREQQAYKRAHPMSRLAPGKAAPGPAAPLHEHAAHHLERANYAARMARGAKGDDARRWRDAAKQHQLSHTHYKRAHDLHTKTLHEAVTGGRYAQRAERLEDF